ncbi:MAG: VIT and VWA domain-containing protein [Phycisphaeraceae bacterium]|nr:VIT and VWA domain-containing protein [Phycisphaeraceae bacterium]
MNTAIRCLILPCLLILTGLASAQPAVERPFARHLVLPQRHVISVPDQTQVQMTGVHARINIDGQLATTTLDIALHNPGRQVGEAELILPVPDGAVIRGFDFQGKADKPTAELLPREQARQISDSIVSQMRDPALLDFLDYQLIRSSVFPVPAQGNQKVRIVYEQMLASEGSRIDYVLPRSESLEQSVPWQIDVTLRSPRPIATIYSPSHGIDVKPTDPHNQSITLNQSDRTTPGSFRLSWLLGGEPLATSVLTFPEAGGNSGYFLLLAGLPPASASRPPVQREVTLVLDRSGSMRGEKLAQAREAARQILAGLEDGEAFNLLTYNGAVDSLAPAPVIKNDQTLAAANAFLDGIRPQGGTNIHAALEEALRPQPHAKMLPMVLFLTDGRPTIGTTDEKTIRELAEKANPFDRRIFTFGVGTDVNSPLLENIAYRSRGTTTFVLPDEDVEVKVADVFRRLKGPVLTDPELLCIDADGKPAPARLQDVLPVRLPDLFEQDRMLVLGRYIGKEPIHLSLTGQVHGNPHSVKFSFDPDRASTDHAFVSRLWADRKIATLIDAVRTAGADPSRPLDLNDPKVKELVDEIVRLSTEFGILTEYTAFLAREGTDLRQPDNNREITWQQLERRALSSRSGLDAINQEYNLSAQKAASKLRFRNQYRDGQMKTVTATNLQPINQSALYRRAGGWEDSRLQAGADIRQPDRTIVFGSAEHLALARQLARENRQGMLAVKGDIFLQVGDQTVLVQAPESN